MQSAYTSGMYVCDYHIMYQLYARAYIIFIHYRTFVGRLGGTETRIVQHTE